MKYLIAETEDRDLPLVRTGLVKLLYLADVEAVRRGNPRLSSVHWIYYKYGPYAFEIEDALHQIVGAEVDETERLSIAGRRYRSYRVLGSQEFRRAREEKALL